MRVFYLNDERQEITVKVMDDTWDDTYSSDNSQHYHRLKPGEGRMFELACPSNSITWIKKWPDMVMISYSDSFAQPRSEEQLPRSGAV